MIKSLIAPLLARPFLASVLGANGFAQTLVLALILALSAVSARADSAQYFYDPAGRLIAVVDPVNGSARYTYDAVGNILSVVRSPITAIIVAQISPSRAPVGTIVTIFGTGFGTAANTTVTFNGKAAPVTSVTTTQIRVAVPSGATSGTVTVKSPAGTATSASSFTVVTGAPPTITSFSPTQTDQGTNVTISGTGFDPVAANNKVLINGRYVFVSAATASTLTILVPPVVGSGRVQVTTANGSATSATFLVVPPLPYLASAVGSVVVSAFGNSATTTLGSPGQIGLVLFDAVAGQRFAMQVTGSSLGNSSSLALLGPDGAAIVPAVATFSGTFLGTTVLPQSGTYSILAASGSGATGSASVALIEVPPDVSGVIAPDATTISLTTTTPGQAMSLTFAGTAGQRVSLLSQLSASLQPSCSPLTIMQPDGATQVFSNGCFNLSSNFTGAVILPVTGTYTIQFVPNGTTTGTAAFTMYDVPPDPSAAIVPGGGSVSLTTTMPGQSMRLTFAGTAGQKVSLTTQLSGGLQVGCSPLTIVQPDTTQLFSNGCFNFPSNFSGSLILPVAGTYTIVFSPNGTTTGTATFALANIPLDVSGTITVGGGPVSLTTTTAGQRMFLTFSGSAGQRVSLLTQISGGLQPGCSPLTIVQPDGTTQIYGNGCFNFPTSYTDALVLPVAGTYTVQVSPNGSTTGTATFTLDAVPPDVTGTITAGGNPVSLTTTTAGQNMSLTFTAAAGQRVSLLTQISGGLQPGCSSLAIVQPDGTTQVYGNGCFNFPSSYTDVVILPVAGTYTIQVNPNGMTTGTATFTLYAEPADASATVTPGGGSVSLTATTPGQNMVLTFAGTAGQRVSLLTQVDSGLLPGCSPLTIMQPNGTTQLFGNGCFNSSSSYTDVLVLPVAGTYTIAFNPNGTTVGTATFTLYDVAPDVTATVAVDDVAASYTTTTPGQAIRVTFAGQANQSVTITVGETSSEPAAACYRITTLNPDGTTLRGDQSCSTGYSSGSLLLPQAGNSVVVVAPLGTATGTFSVGVSAQ